MKGLTDEELFEGGIEDRKESRFQAGDFARRLLYYPVRYFFLGLYFIGNVVIGLFLALGIFILWLINLPYGNK